MAENITPSNPDLIETNNKLFLILNHSAIQKAIAACYHVLAWLLFILVFPIALTFFACGITWKYAVVQYVKWFKPKLYRVLNHQETFYALDQFWKDTDIRKSCTVVVVKVDGVINVDKFTTVFCKEVFKWTSTSPTSLTSSSFTPSDGNHDDVKLRKLQMIPFEYAGSYFWTGAKYFLVREHIRKVKDVTGERELKKFVGEFLQTPFPEKRPLWEIVIFRVKENGEYTPLDARDNTMIIRVHPLIQDCMVPLLKRLFNCSTTNPDLDPDQECKVVFAKVTLGLGASLPLMLVRFYRNLFRTNGTSGKAGPKTDENIKDDVSKTLVTWCQLPQETVDKIQRNSNLSQEAVDVLLGRVLMLKLSETNSQNERITNGNRMFKCMRLIQEGKLIVLSALNNVSLTQNLQNISQEMVKYEWEFLTNIHVFFLNPFPKTLQRALFHRMGQTMATQRLNLNWLHESRDPCGNIVNEIISICSTPWKSSALSMSSTTFHKTRVYSFIVGQSVCHNDALLATIPHSLSETSDELLRQSQDEEGFVSIPIA